MHLTRWATLGVRAALCTLGAGCGRLVEMRVLVQVPREVHAEFLAADALWQPRIDPADRRGRVVLSFDQPNLERTVSLDILCELRSEDPLVLTYETAGMGCAQAGRIRAWLQPVRLDESTICAPGQEVLSFRAQEPEPEWPQAAERVLEELEGAEACGAISEGAVMVIGWPEPADGGG